MSTFLVSQHCVLRICNKSETVFIMQPPVEDLEERESCMLRALEVERKVVAEFKAEVELSAKHLKQREDAVAQREQDLDRKEAAFAAKVHPLSCQTLIFTHSQFQQAQVDATGLDLHLEKTNRVLLEHEKQEKRLKQRMEEILEKERALNSKAVTSNFVHDEVTAMMESLNQSLQHLADDKAALEKQKSSFKEDVQVPSLSP